MLNALKCHMWTLPRWFAAPFFGIAALLGVFLAGGSFSNPNTWLILAAVLCNMAGGHAMNSFLDYAWTGLDKGEKEDRSAEKSYCGGQNLIENKKVSLNGITVNAVICYLLSAMFILLVGVRTGSGTTAIILFSLWLAGIAIPFWYSIGKFNWTHELSLGVGCGLLPVLMGEFAVSNHPPILAGILVSIFPAVVLSFAGLALDEFPDSEANLKKGVKSLAFKVWQYSDWTFENAGWKEGKNQVPIVKSYSLLQWYLSVWFLMLFGLQILLINLGVMKPLSALSFIMFPFILCSFVFFKRDFNRTAVAIVIFAAAYLALMLVGQVVG